MATIKWLSVIQKYLYTNIQGFERYTQQAQTNSALISLFSQSNTAHYFLKQHCW